MATSSTSSTSTKKPITANTFLKLRTSNNNFNAAEALKNREFQQFMSSTAHQREVVDLALAGLNPVLSANGGAPMATGAQAVADTSEGAAIASKYASDIAKYTANLQYKQNIAALNNAVKVTKLNNEAALKQAQISANAQMSAAGANAAATRDAAATNAAASRYAADQSRAAQKYTADQNLAGTRSTNATSITNTTLSNPIAAGIYGGGAIWGEITGSNFYNGIYNNALGAVYGN